MLGGEGMCCPELLQYNFKMSNYQQKLQRNNEVWPIHVKERLQFVPKEAQTMKMISYQIQNINKKTDIIFQKTEQKIWS